MIVLSILITVLYVCLMVFIIIGQKKLKPFILESVPPTTQFSIIIPFRNEAKNLEALLQSLFELNYPKAQFELILVNDFSSDNFRPIIAHFKEKFSNLSCVDSINAGSAPKKAALSLGVLKAKYNWIVTSDADCTFSKNWLQAFNQKILKDNPLMIAGLVKYHHFKGFLNHFQCLDLLSLQATLLGTFGWQKPMLCHGANLCYAKVLFNELNGFSSHRHIASGDDVFLLEAAANKYPDKVMAVNSLETVVSTNVEPTLKALLSQRMRWAAKATAYKNWPIKAMGLIVFAMNFLCLLAAVLSLLSLVSAKLFWIIFLIKFTIDGLVLYPMAQFFKQKSVLKSYLLSSFLYPLFSVTSVFLGFTKAYTWKNRAFKV
ncbi:MAG: glycosyltransferase [Flavobacteriales bacterium CG_4_8_14_3_um_filter_35_10]|nr:glycosyltransferase [Zetaproteobacteria bacterium]OIO10583.1 MAG: hypothetical protein AUJ53_06615 [Flavobacteriaceae bacterium CG1_02_35_72]PIR12568.1 MAG: glycosyltransferase [Flavobacteriales bacterium CG11_big_fil_rev_8_21_14_0_20_35_7]PIX06719.1 MAG: glycosyltransferase [Flavobacteriales bacterium CG_4_8_14_3_um_filter_35_10]